MTEMVMYQGVSRSPFPKSWATQPPVPVADFFLGECSFNGARDNQMTFGLRMVSPALPARESGRFEPAGAFAVARLRE